MGGFVVVFMLIDMQLPFAKRSTHVSLIETKDWAMGLDFDVWIRQFLPILYVESVYSLEIFQIDNNYSLIFPFSVYYATFITLALSTQSV